MKQQIKNRYDDSILFECEADSLRGCVEQAVKEKVSLRGAYLGGANLGDANLGGANLRGAYLRGANLPGANIEGEIIIKTPISILNMTWDILITNNYMRIGCQRHTHAEWEAFTESQIADMENRASEFWKVNKDWLLEACKSQKGKL